LDNVKHHGEYEDMNRRRPPRGDRPRDRRQSHGRNRGPKDLDDFDHTRHIDASDTYFDQAVDHHRRRSIGKRLRNRDSRLDGPIVRDQEVHFDDLDNLASPYTEDEF